MSFASVETTISMGTRLSCFSAGGRIAIFDQDRDTLEPETSPIANYDSTYNAYQVYLATCLHCQRPKFQS